jgi:hypothetical protein
MVKTYRSTLPIVGGSVGFIGFLGLGLSMIISAKEVGASGVIIGVFLLICAVVFAVAVLSNGVHVTSEGIAYRYNLRRKIIPWSAVKSFEVGRARGLGSWSSLAVNCSSGRALISSIVGTKAYVEKIAAELRSFQRDQTT